MIWYRVNIENITIDLINLFRPACEDDTVEILKDVLKNKASMWCRPGQGFCILQEVDKEILHVCAMVGRSLYDSLSYQSLYKLAKDNGFRYLSLTAKNDAVKKLLIRMGFEGEWDKFKMKVKV